MAIVCGTDFSVAAAPAATAAALLAARTGEELHLVHVLVGLDEGALAGGPQAVLAEPARTRLAAEAERLRALGARVRAELLTGTPDEALLHWAEGQDAWLVVVGIAGRRGVQRLFVGSTTTRTVLCASGPVLVVPGDSLATWASSGRPLRVVLGADDSSTTEAAVRWLQRLCASIPCEIVAAQVIWPPELHGRFGLTEVPMGSEALPEDAQATIERELRQRVAPLEANAPVRLLVRPGFGQPATHLLELARREQADVLVVGTHQRRGLDRLRYGSVSMGVLHHAELPVVLVPPARAVDLGPIPVIRRVLASTDFSAFGDRATRMAYAQLPLGGTVRLVHVVERGGKNPVYTHHAIGAMPPGDGEEVQRALSEALRALVPPEATERGIVTEVEVIESNDPAVAIAQAAERFGADVICMGSHGRTGLRKTVLGSVTEAVVCRTRRPVLVVRPPAD